MRKKPLKAFIVVFLSFFSAAVFVFAQGSGSLTNVSNSSFQSTEPRIAVNQHGEIMVVWVETIGSIKQIYYAFRRGNSWSAPAPIQGQSNYNIDPDVYRGRSGGFVAVWHDKASGDCIRFSDFNGSVWSTPFQVSQNGGYMMGSPRVITSASRIMVAWNRGNPIWRDIYVSIWDGHWRGISQISLTPSTASACVSLAVGPNGRFYATWQDAMDKSETEDKLEIAWNVDDGKGNWPTEKFLTNFEDWLFRPSMAVNNNNDLLVTFYYFQQGGYTSYVRRGGSWAALQYIGTAGGEHEKYFSQAAPFGDGFIFIYRDRAYNILYSLYQAGNWSKPTVISTGNNNYHPSIAYYANLGVAAAWTNRDNNNVWVRVFNLNQEDPDPEPEPEPSDVEPPLEVKSQFHTVHYNTRNLRVEKIVNRNLFTVKYLNRVSWDKNPDLDHLNADIYKYRVYRRRKGSPKYAPIRELDAGVFSFIDDDQVGPADDLEYMVKGVDSLQNEFFKFNRIFWKKNPQNDINELVIIHYRLYKKIRGHGDEEYVLCHQADAESFSWVDLDFEIRRGRIYEYTVSAVDADGRESEKNPALSEEVVVEKKHFQKSGKNR